MGQTSIEWTATVHADGTVTPGKTWNPTRGCSRVSQGCVHCLVPSTRILYEDFTWRPIGDAVVGDRLLAFDETNKPGHPRKFRTASIERVWAISRETRRLITQQTEIITTADHRWLRRFSNRWPTTDRLQIGKPLRQIGVTPAPLLTEDYRHGYLAGMTEGDGTFRYEPGQRSDKMGFPQAYWRVALIEKDESALGRLVAYLAHFGIESYIRPFVGGSVQRMLKVEVRSLSALEKLHPLVTKEVNSTEFARGFIAGFFDAEGSGEASLRFSQVDRSTLQRIHAYGKALGFQIEVEPEYKPGLSSEARLVGSTLGRLRFLSIIQNALCRKAGIVGMKQQQISDAVVRVEKGAVADVVDIQTSTGTFFAEGLATHNCYAETLAGRYSAFGAKPDSPFRGFVTKVNGHASWTGKVELVESMLELPLRWKKPCRIFCTSMSDMYHENLPIEALDKIYAVMALADWHIYQNLTKRPERRREYISDPETPYRIQRAIDKILVDQEMRKLPELWEKILGYEDYSVSNHGEVRSAKGLRGEHTLKQSEHSQGYRQVALCSEGVAKTFLVHCLVLHAFAGEPPEGTEARHRTGDKTDNRIANLSWGDRTANMGDAARHGTAGVWMKGKATLAQDQVTEIRKLRKDGIKLDDIATQFKSNRQQISAICLGQIFKSADLQWPLPQVWEGVSVEDQATADERIPLLLQTPAAIRFVSYEPALGPVNFLDYMTYSLDEAFADHPAEKPLLDWLIAGYESGPGARPADEEWIRSVKNQCVGAGVAFFYKQSAVKGRKISTPELDGQKWMESPK